MAVRRTAAHRAPAPPPNSYLLRRPPENFRLKERGPNPGGEAGRFQPDYHHGAWLLLVHHHAGSLAALVARWRDVALSCAILLLILTTMALLVDYSRQAQSVAELQMNFVAGVSHELRTPLTVIRTAAFNL